MENTLQISTRKAVLAAVIVISLAACSQKPADNAAKPKDSASKADTTVLAEVNGKKITAEDFKMEAASLGAGQIQSLSDDANKQKLIDKMVEKQLVVQKAVSAGLDKDPDVVKSLEYVKGKLLFGLYIKNNILDKSKVTDADVKDYFTKHKDDLGSVRISHILVRTKAEAEAVLAKLKAGEDYKKLAKSNSLDPKTKDNGGDIGYVNWTDISSPDFRDTVFKLKTGESGAVQSQAGYHVIRVTDKKPAADAEFEKIKERIKASVELTKREELYNSITKELKDKAKVVPHPDSLKALNVSSLLELPSAGMEQPK